MTNILKLKIFTKYDLYNCFSFFIFRFRIFFLTFFFWIFSFCFWINNVNPQNKNTLVPGAPPQNVTAEAVSPTSIRVSWEPPPAERSNGRIVYYRLLQVESGRSDSEASVFTTNQSSILLDELKKWTEYRIWVLAGTSVGDGPPSYPITVRTHEDGTHSFTIILS